MATSIGKSEGHLILVSFAGVVVSLLIAVYVAGYFALGEFSIVEYSYQVDPDLSSPPDEITMRREYSRQWEATVFHPAARLETWARGVEVNARWRHE